MSTFPISPSTCPLCGRTRICPISKFSARRTGLCLPVTVPPVWWWTSVWRSFNRVATPARFSKWRKAPLRCSCRACCGRALHRKWFPPSSGPSSRICRSRSSACKFRSGNKPWKRPWKCCPCIPPGRGRSATWFCSFPDRFVCIFRSRKSTFWRQRLKEPTIAQLQSDLSSSRLYLQTLLEERDAKNQELVSANEEIQSANEELQSTNEELETTKEELQSSNEELQTVNDELQNRNTVLTQTTNDLSNLLNSVNLPVLMLSEDLSIRHFTPQAQRLMNVRTSDIGRPFGDIRL